MKITMIMMVKRKQGIKKKNKQRSRNKHEIKKKYYEQK